MERKNGGEEMEGGGMGRGWSKDTMWEGENIHPVNITTI